MATNDRPRSVPVLSIGGSNAVAGGPALQVAVALLNEGRVVAIPTDTVYGLAADLRSRAAVQTLYRIKERPEELPLILLGATREQFVPYILPLEERVRALAERHWPGALTLVVPRNRRARQYAVTRGATIGIRIPNHPGTLELLRRYGRPLATTSANISGRPAGRDAQVVAQELKDTELALVLDAGPVRLGEPSTVLDVTVWPPKVLRQGVVLVELGDDQRFPSPPREG